MYMENHKQLKNMNEPPNKYKESVFEESSAARKDSLVKRLNSLSDIHLKINFVISFILLIFTAAVIFYIPMYKVENKD
jgi:hypothetical protein